MSAINPEDLKEGLSTAITWEVPVGGQLHKYNYLHIYKNGHFQMDRNGETPTVWKPSIMEMLFKVTDSSTRPISKSFKFADLNLTVWKLPVDDGWIYALNVNGHFFSTYKEEYYKMFNVWKIESDGKEWRIVLDEKTLEVWGNGEKIDDAKESFLLGTAKCRIETRGDESSGIAHTLLVNGKGVPLDINLDEELHRRHDVVKNSLKSVGSV